MESESEIITRNINAPFFDISKIIKVRGTLKIAETSYSQETIRETRCMLLNFQYKLQVRERMRMVFSRKLKHVILDMKSSYELFIKYNVKGINCSKLMCFVRNATRNVIST
jgi:hypothetical protein